MAMVLLLALLGASALPAPAASAADGVWTAQYYANPDLVGQPVMTQTVGAVNFDWGRGSPHPSIPVDNFSARWTSNLYLTAGRYRFYARTDDGVRLFVDDELLIDQWHEMSATTHMAERAVDSGYHAIRLEYFERSGLASATLWWEQISPPTGPDGAWQGWYYNNRNLAPPAVFMRFDPSINFNWSNGSPDPRVVPDNFSVRWNRQIDFTNGRYTFFVRADDGVRLYVDDHLLIDDWRDSAGAVREGTITLAGRHRITLEYYEHMGLAQVQLWWESEPIAGRLIGNLITCMRPQNSWIKVYRLTPAGNWLDMNPQGWGPIDQSGYRKIDGLPIDPYYGYKGQPYRVELWANGSLNRSVGNIAAGQPEFRIYPFTDTHTPWGCPAP